MSAFSLLYQLFPFFVAFYVLDCITYVKPFQVLCTRYMRWPFALKRRGLFLTNILPGDRSFVLWDLPLYYRPNGVWIQKCEFAFAVPMFDPVRYDFVRYDDMTDISVDGDCVVVNGGVFLKLRSSIMALHVARALSEQKNTAPSVRADRLSERTRRERDPADLDAHMESTQRIRRILAWLGAAFLLLFFVLLPAALYTPLAGFVPTMWILVPIVLAYAGTSIIVLLNAGDLYGIKPPTSTLITLLLSPVTAAHIGPQVERESLAKFDWMLAASKLLPPSTFRTLMRRELGRLRLIMERYPNHDLQDYWAQREAFYGDLIAAQGLSVDDMLAIPHRRDPAATAYCILCDAEYQGAADRCSECDADLAPFDPDPAMVAAKP